MRYRKRYRVESNRQSKHDYSRSGYYFITICTQDRFEWFGSVRNKRMCINTSGSIVHTVWNNIPNHFENIVIDEFVVMPDHVHGIVRIVDNEPNVETLHATSLPRSNNVKLSNEWFSDISPKRGTLSVVVRSFKSAATHQIRKIKPQFQWQANYHDRIIRSDRELRAVRKYIRNNPSVW